jgi:disulfide oxidoreductase YuzD
LNNTYNLSPAERYIIQQSQMIVDPNESQSGTTSICSSTSSISHAEKMKEWREKEINNIYKHEPYRYKYGTPPSTSNRSTFRRIDVQTNPNNISSFSTGRAEKK